MYIYIFYNYVNYSHSMVWSLVRGVLAFIKSLLSCVRSLAEPYVRVSNLELERRYRQRSWYYLKIMTNGITVV